MPISKIKICRYQQFYAIKATLARVTKCRGDSIRQGGVIWHTTGSGKSLTMVMANNLRYVEYGRSEIGFRLNFKDRKTLAIHVYPDRSVEVDAPDNTSLEKIKDKVAEHNHSKDFYRLLEKAMPDWEKRKDKLETTMEHRTL